MKDKNLIYSVGIIAVITLIVYLLKTGKMNKVSSDINRPTVPGNIGTGVGGYGPRTGTASPGSDSEKRLLGIGTTGGEVRILQQLLNLDGAAPALDVDGNFGPLTTAALKAETGELETTLTRYKAFRNRSQSTYGQGGFFQ
jgi:hypothetical protein